MLPITFYYIFVPGLAVEQIARVSIDVKNPVCNHP